MELRRFAIFLAIGLSISVASVAAYLLTLEKYRIKKSEDDNKDPETLNFPFLRDIHSVEFIKNSKVMFIMRGLPGSGKSVVAKQIKQDYGDLAVICSADDFRLNDLGEYVWTAEEYEATHQKCRDKARQTCEDMIPVVIIDNTNIEKRMLYNYVTIAHNAGYHVVLVEPRTRWRYSVTDCALKNHHDVTEDILQEQLSKFQPINAVYYGWFPSEEISRTLKDRMFKMFSDCLAKIHSFKDYLIKENQQDEHGFPTTIMTDSSDISVTSLSCLEKQLDHLHVTAFFNRRGQAQRTSDYVSSSAVQEALGSATTLSIIAWTISPKAVTARVKLNPQQLKLWGNLDSGDLKEGCGNFSGKCLTESTTCASQSSVSPNTPLSYAELAVKPTIGKGDTVHITLSIRNDVTPVQGRNDLGDLIRLELTDQSYEEYKVTEGVARDYGEGLWAVYLNEPIYINVLFTGYYGS
ncbi:hypothetical protein ACROYT_G007488 [Oculina patagonica]